VCSSRKVVLRRATQVADAADLGKLSEGRCRRPVELLLDRELGLVGELVAIAGEELDAVVAIGVVRGGQHRCEVEAIASDQQRSGRRRKHAAQQRVAACRADARGDRRLEHLA